MSMFKRIKAVAAAVMASMVVLMPQRAEAVYATEFTQLANHFELIKQLEQQTAMVQQAIRQYQNLLTNTNPLGQQTWSQALAEMRKLNSLLGQAKSLSFTAGNLDGQFAQKYGDYSSYVSSQIGDGELTRKYQQWSEDTNSSVLTTLKAAGLETEQIEGAEDGYLRHLQQLSETAEGRMQALQISNQIAIQLARQMQKLRQLMLVQMQLQANFIQQQMDREAAQSAAWRNFAKKPQVSPGNGRRF
jgi:type IV secretion system protein TrbJ